MNAMIKPNGADGELSELLNSIPVAQHLPDFWDNLLTTCTESDTSMPISAEPVDTQITQPMSLGDFQVHCDMVETRKIVPLQHKKPSKFATYGLAAASIVAIAGLAIAFFELRGPITQDLESRRIAETEERQQPAAVPPTAGYPSDAQSILPTPAELATTSSCYTHTSTDGTQARVIIEQTPDQVLVNEEQIVGPESEPDDVFSAVGIGTYISATQLTVIVDISVDGEIETRSDSQTWTVTSDQVTTAQPGRFYRRTNC